MYALQALTHGFQFMAAENAAYSVMHSFIEPVFITMTVIASLASVAFIIVGGYEYMGSAGSPDKLMHAKKTLKNALIGLVVVLGASLLTALLSHAYGNVASGSASHMPALTSIKPAPAPSGLADVLIKAVTGFLQNIIDSIASPFMAALKYFTTSTPLMAANSSVFKLWLAVVSIADALFVLVIGLLGFHIMSSSSLGLEEIEFKHLLPQIGTVFLLVNTSIFAIDGVISVCNAMIRAIYAVFPAVSVWSTLDQITEQATGISLATLLIMIIFLILAVILLIYYVGRLVTLYIGAILSPLLFLLWLVPGFKDFAETAAKVYLGTIFVLFIHVVILLLAASIFAGMSEANPTHALDPIMSMVVGLATVVALLKTQGVMMQLSYASIGPRSARMLGGQLVNSVSYLSGRSRNAHDESIDHTTRNKQLPDNTSNPRPSQNFNPPSDSRASNKTLTAKDIKVSKADMALKEGEV